MDKKNMADMQDDFFKNRGKRRITKQIKDRNIKSIKEIVDNLEKEFKINLDLIYRKKIIFHSTNFIFITPESVINTSNKGLVDITEIQKEILDNQMKTVIIIFRISDYKIMFLNYQNLRASLTEKNIKVNSRAGRHWKIDLFPLKEYVIVQKSLTPLRSYSSLPFSQCL